MNKISRLRFVQDDDAHWYLIFDRDLNKFREWVSGALVRELCTPEELKKMGVKKIKSFDKYRCDSPEFYTIEAPERDK